jgi:hypothetical protein
VRGVKRDIELVPVTGDQLAFIEQRVGHLALSPHTTPTLRLLAEAYYRHARISGNEKGRKMLTPPQVGDRIATWFSGEQDGHSTILEVQPYTGKYTSLFKWWIKATARATENGYLWIAL